MDIIWVIFSLIGVLGLFFIMVYAMKKLNRGIGYINGNRMKVVDRVSVGRDGMLLVVSVAGKLMLIGVSGQHIEKLSDIDMTLEEYNSAGGLPQTEMKNSPDFVSAFFEAVKKNKGSQEDKGDGKDGKNT